MSVEIFITGNYENYEMRYFGYALKEDGGKVRISGSISGSQTETEVSAVGVALRYAYKNYKDAVIYTDFINAAKWANGEWNASSKRVKEYIDYIKRVSEKIHVVIDTNIPSERLAELQHYLKLNIGESKTVQKPFKKERKAASSTVGWKQPQQHQFRVIVYRTDGTVLCEVNEKQFCGNTNDAIYFANWYEQQGNKVVREGLPT